MAAGRTVLITGASRGIGFEFAKYYHDAGWNVIATCRCPDAASSTSAYSRLHSIGIKDIFQLDVTDEASILALAQTLVDRKIHLLINNAGIYVRDYGKLIEIKAADVLTHFQVNSVGPLLMVQAFINHLTAAAHDESHATGLAKVINISSSLGSIENTRTGGSVAYRASKAALNSITKTLANMFKIKDIPCLIVALHPGLVKTDLTYNGQISALDSVSCMASIIENLSAGSSGAFLDLHGNILPF